MARKPPGKEKFKAPLKGTPKNAMPPSSRMLHLVMALVIVPFLVGGYLFYHLREQQMRQRVEGGLSIVAQLKVEQIAQWRAERLTDADMLVGSPFFTEGVEKYMASPTDTEIRDKVLARLAIIGKSHPYQDILLVDVNGSVLLNLNDSVHRLGDLTLAQLAVAIKEHKAVMVDFHYPPDSNSPHLDVIAPLFPWGQDSPQAIGAVVFCIGPSQYLYPLLQPWPIPSETAEILLVERDGDQVLFLNDLRYQKDTALKLRIPLSQQENPAVMAVLGKEGVVEGKDYRGAEVLAVLEHIPDSPWYMVAKIDTSEAISAWRFQTGIIVASVAGLLAAALAFIGLIWQRRQRLAYQALYQAELESQALRSHFEYLVKYANDIIILVDENQHIVEVNDRALEAYGYTRQEILDLPLAALVATGDLPSYQSRLRKIQQKGKIVAEAIHQRKDGSTFPVEVSGRTIKIEDKPYLQEIVRDITERMEAEESLRLSEQNFRDSIENSPLGIRIANEDGKTLYANQALLDIYGYSSIEELEAVPRKQRYTPESYDEHGERTKKRRQGEFAPTNYEISIVRKDGDVRHLAASRGEVLWDGEKQFQVVYQDITERKRAEEKLRESEERFRALTENSSDIVTVIDSLGIVQYQSPNYRTIWGREPNGEIGRAIFNDVHPDDMALVGEKFNYLFMNPEATVNIEIRAQHQDGSWRTIDVVGRNLLDHPAVRGIVANFRDITKRKQAEEALRESEQKYRLLAENARDIIWTMDMNLQFTYMSPSVLQVRGYTAEEVMSQSMEEIFTPSSLEVVMKALEEELAIEGTEQKDLTRSRILELEHTCKDGSTVWVEMIVTFLRDENGRPIGLIGISRDITERKQAEERYKVLFDTNIDGLCVMDETMKVLLVNEATARIFGFDCTEEVLEVNPFDFIPPQERERVLETITKDMFENDKKQVNEFQLVNKAGKEVWISAVGAVIEYQGKPAGLISFRDVTEQKRAEGALTRSEEKYRTILSEMQDNYFEADLAGNLTFFNDSTSNSLGYSAEELMGMSYREFTVSEDIKLVYKAVNKVYRTNRPNKGFSWKVVRKDGTVGFVETTVSPLRNPKGEIIGIRGVGRDITERKRAEEERKQLEQKAQVTSRLASVGEMAAGVAHEINNPLTGVIGYAQLLMDGKDIPSDIRRDLAAINEGAQRVASIVKRLLVFSRQVKPERRDVDINELIESTLALRAYHLRVNNIKVTTQLAPDLPETMADPGQLQQVFLNLVVNAETEMKLARGKGKLLIKTEKVDNTIRISFKDNGPGIAKKNLERIFDPFFTTREVGQGTGLGLSLCHGIVAEHNGKIYVESKLGKGATFIMELPVVTEAEQPKPSEPVVEEPEKVAKARILVVDDEQVIRDLVKRVLAGEGYEVETVNNAGDALKKIEGKRYNLVLIDIKMPGMDGVELYKRIQKIAKSLARRVVFITGDILGAHTEKFLSETKVAHIDKPFSAEQLKREVNRALTGGQ